MSRKKIERFIIEDLSILEAGSEGVCIGKYEGRVVFVSNVVPGDVVDVEVYCKKHAYYQARPIQLKQASPKRVPPRCEHFGICGGCKWQNMDYPTQLFYKQKQVQDNFQRIGHFPFGEILPIIASDLIFEYRNKIEYTFSNRRWVPESQLEAANNGELNLNGVGFHLPKQFNKVLDIYHCHLHNKVGNDIRNAIRNFAHQNGIPFWNVRLNEGSLRNLLIRTSASGDLMVIVVFYQFNRQMQDLLDFVKEKFPSITSLMYVENKKPNDSIADQEVVTYFGADYMTERMNNLQFKVAPLAFYQVNVNQALKLYKVVEKMAKIDKRHIVYDLYTGTGTIALFVSGKAQKVVGIEYVLSAVENAKENAHLNAIENATFFAGNMAKVFTDEFVEQNGKPDILITDPPRAGMTPDVIEQILKIEPQRIVYVSCNPATQARDIAILCQKYEVQETQPVDMFPHTHHVENVCTLELKGNEA